MSGEGKSATKFGFFLSEQDICKWPCLTPMLLFFAPNILKRAQDVIITKIFKNLDAFPILMGSYGEWVASGAPDRILKELFESRRDDMITGKPWPESRRTPLNTGGIGYDPPDDENTWSYDETTRIVHMLDSISRDLLIQTDMPRTSAELHDIEQRAVKESFHGEVRLWNAYLRGLEERFPIVHAIGTAHYTANVGLLEGVVSDAMIELSLPDKGETFALRFSPLEKFEPMPGKDYYPNAAPIPGSIGGRPDISFMLQGHGNISEHYAHMLWIAERGEWIGTIYQLMYGGKTQWLGPFTLDQYSAGKVIQFYNLSGKMDAEKVSLASPYELRMAAR